MPTINRLTRIDTVTDGDVVPAYSQTNGDARGAAMSVLFAYMVSKFGTNVGDFLEDPSSANLAFAMTDETGTGQLVFGTGPSLVSPSVTALKRGAPVTKVTSFTVAASESWIICDGAASITVILPTASDWTGREIMLKTIAAFTVVSATANVVPLAGGAAGTAILAAVAGRWSTLVSDGVNWVTMQGV